MSHKVLIEALVIRCVKCHHPIVSFNDRRLTKVSSASLRRGKKAASLNIPNVSCTLYFFKTEKIAEAGSELAVVSCGM